MRLSEKKKLSNMSIGIFLTLMPTNSQNSFLERQSSACYRTYATLYLPTNCPERWASDFKMYVKILENGNHLTVNLDWQNCKSFLSYEQLIKFDRELAFLSFHVYNAVELLRCKLDTDSIYKKHRKTKCRDYYLQSKAR